MVGQLEPSGRPPSAGQRTHWYVYSIAAPIQVPCETVRADPSTGDPETTGSAVLTGTSWPVTTAVGGDRASPEPSPFVAVTRTRSVNPMSASSTTCVGAV